MKTETIIYGVEYLPEHLTGEGTINGYRVKCIPPDSVVKFHTGYDLDENDFHDVRAICEKFKIPLPSEYEKFIE
jgi:lincosamide nucleotidyltransferase A/C/D/E